MERPKPQLGTQNETTSDRILAWVVDTILFFIVAIVLAQAISDGGLIIIIVSLGKLMYHIFFEATYGQTLGKRLTNIVVVKNDGNPCDWKASTIRNVLRMIDGLPAFYLVGMIVIFISDNNQRIGDIGANTVVTAVATDMGVPDEEWSGFVIETHGEGGNQTIELVNETDVEVDLSGARLLHNSEEQFRFQLTQVSHRPGQSMSELLNRDFDVEPGSPLTLEITSGDKKGEQYEVRWN